MKKTLTFLLALACLPAYAYIGPGLGAGTIASVLGLLGSLVLIAIALIYYPIKRLIKKFKNKRKSQKDQ